MPTMKPSPRSQALDRWIAEATAQGYVAVDTETDALDSMQAGLVGVSLATAAGQGLLHSAGAPGRRRRTCLAARRWPARSSCEDAIAHLKPLLENPAVLKIGQNLKYDMEVLRALRHRRFAHR